MPDAAVPEPPSVLVLRRLDSGLGLLEHAVLVVFLTALVAVGVYQSAASHLFDKNDSWPFEIIRYSVFFVAMAGAALAAQRQQMISMDFVTRLLSPRAKMIMRVVVALFVILVCVLLYMGGMEVRASTSELNEQYEYISPSTGLLALPFGALLIAVHYTIHAIIDAIYLARGEVTPSMSGPQVH